MKNSIIVLAIVFGFFTKLSAQSAVGHYNQVEIIESLPERDSLEKVLSAYTQKLEQSYQKMMAEYQKKVEEFESDPDRPATITEIMQNEIMEMQQRIQQFPQTAQQDILKRQETLFLPLQEKILKAVNEVAAEKGLMYVFDVSQGNPIVISEQNNLTAAIKTKLGI